MSKSPYSDQANRMYEPKHTKKTKAFHPVFSLKVSEAEKYANDKQWFKDYMEYIIPNGSTQIEGVKEMKLAYEIYNDNLEGYKEELNRFCNRMGENIGQLEEEVIAYPLLYHKVNVLKGENLKRNDTFKIVLLSAKAIKDKNEQLLEAIKASVDEKVLLHIESVQQQLEGKSEQEVQKYVEEMTTQKTPEDLLQKDFQSEWEIFYSQGLKYCNYDQNVKLKRDETFQDTLTVDRCFIYSGWKAGKPFLEVRNTLHTGFHKSPNEMFINKGDIVFYKKPITIADVYNYYGDLLSDEELEDISTNSASMGKNHSVIGNNSAKPEFSHFDQHIFEDIDSGKDKYNFQDKNIGTHQGQGLDRRREENRLVWETHFEFKAFKPVIFISYKDEFNRPVSVPIAANFKIPTFAVKEKFVNKWGNTSVKYVWFHTESNTEYTAEKLWIPRKYEVVRLGDSTYPICREVPFQNTNITQPYSSFNLSTFGAVFTSRNAKSISLLQRAIPSYFQFLYVKHVQNKELAKYQGYIQSVDLDQIPDVLGQDLNGDIIKDPIATWLLYRKQTGIDFYSGTQTTTGGSLPSTRSPGSSGYILGTASEIYQLQQLLEVIKQEIGLAMGISPQREAQFSNNSNVGDNKQAIVQSHHITEPYFFYHNEVWRFALEDYLNNFRTHCRNLYEEDGVNPLFHYILPDGTEELLEVTPKMLEAHSFGLYPQSGAASQEYLEIMKQQSFAIAQNAGEGAEAISSIIKGITSGSSPEEIHKMIKMQSAKQAERAQQGEQMKLKVQEEYIARERESREDVQAHEIEKEHIKGQYKLQSDTIRASGYGADVDEDGTPDPLQVAAQLHKEGFDSAKLSIEQQKLGQKDRQIEQKDREMVQKKGLEEKKIAASKHKNNPN
jgi:hypothetical protein